MYLKSSLLALILFVMYGAFAIAFGAKKDTGFLNRSVVIGKATYRYQIYVPQDWSGSKKWPVVLFLHGAGERGEDGLVQTQVGIATAIRMHADRFACVVVMPQCRKGIWWSHPDMEAQAMAALEKTIKEFKGDTDRVYLTGLSMGGYGAWSIAFRFPGKFAALAPICGGVRPPARGSAQPDNPFVDPNVDPYALVAAKIGKTPVWIFHGEADPVVPVAESRKMNEAIKAAGGLVKYTEYPGIGHNSWDRAYAETEFMPWLLAQRRAQK